MITFPTTLEEAHDAHGEFRAGGTDLQDRRYLGVSSGDLRDLRDMPGLDEIEWGADGVRIGARTRVATVASDPRIAAEYPGLSAAAGGLATPQIRALATLGGNLLQHVRCWYYRNPDTLCLKRGGTQCLARDGDHLYSSCFDLGPCVSPHPSTLGMALVAHDATVHAYPGAPLAIAALFGDGSDPRRENTLAADRVLTRVHLPRAIPGERAAYFRAISRSRAEWPLVEVIARLWLDGDRIARACIAMGGVANIPMRLARVEASLVGQRADEDTLVRASQIAAEGATPLPMTRYKVALVPGVVRHTLQLALAQRPTVLG